MTFQRPALYNESRKEADMSSVKPIEERIMNKLKYLPDKGKREVLAFVDSMTVKETEKTRKALKKTAGSWRGLVEAEKLKKAVYEDRLIITRRRAAF